MAQYTRPSTWLLVLALVLALVLLLGTLSASAASGSLSKRPGPMAVGHRGFPLVAPENTMPSFQAAYTERADGIETDLRFTKDGFIVLLHDDSLDRTTNCSGRVSDYTLKQLEQCDAGYKFNPKFKGTRVPLFSEVVAWAKQNGLFIIMDLKVEGLGKKIADIVIPLGMEDQVVASCWTQTQVEDISRYLNSTVKQKLSGNLPWQDPYFWRDLLAADVHGISINYGNAPMEFVRAAHLRMLPVYTWTVDSINDLKVRILNHDDGILTNDMHTLVGLLDSLHEYERLLLGQ